MGTEKSLGLSDRFEPSHPSLPDPSRRMRLLCPVILICSIVMNGFWDHFSMRHSITAQFIGQDLPSLTAMASQ